MEELKWKESKTEYYSKVKVCPLCGGYARLEPRSKTVIKGEVQYIAYCRCVECDVRGPRVLLGSDPHKARESAIKRWNRRVYED